MLYTQKYIPPYCLFCNSARALMTKLYRQKSLLVSHICSPFIHQDFGLIANAFPFGVTKRTFVILMRGTGETDVRVSVLVLVEILDNDVLLLERLLGLGKAKPEMERNKIDMFRKFLFMRI